MIDFIITYIKQGYSFYSLEIYEFQGVLSYQLLEVKRKKEALFISKEITFSSLGQLSSEIKKDIPVFLVINTNEVITKIGNTLNMQHSEAIAQTAFPSLDLDTFCYEIMLSKNTYMASILKKEKLNNYVQSLSELKINLMNISLGISNIRSILDYFTTNTIHLNNLSIVIHEHVISSINPLSTALEQQVVHYDLNNLVVSNKSLLGFASILNGISNQIESSSNFENIRIELKSEFQYKRYFNLLLKTGLAFILGLLFINFFVFHQYYQEVSTLQLDASLNDAHKNRLSYLKNIVKSKEERVANILSAANSKTSFYLDQIAQKLPHTILLNEIQFQPLLKPVRESKPIEIATNTVLISGDVSNGEVFSYWIESLEKFPWAKKVETLAYGYGTINRANFSIKITLYEK